MTELAFPQPLVPGTGGAILRCCHTALDKAKPSVLIALPFGVPVSLARAAFDKLGPAFNVVTWESRYILNLDQVFTGKDKVGPAEQVADMICILQHLDIAAATLIGYCSGAGLSLLAAKQHPDVFTDLILVNGEYQLFKKGYQPTAYQRSFDTFLPVAAADRRQTEFLFARGAKISQARTGGAAQSELEQQLTIAYSKEEYLFRYATTYMAYRNFDALAAAREVRQRTFVLTSRQDVHAAMEHSEAVRDAIPGSKTFIGDHGDHYEFCRAGSVILDQIGAHMIGTTP